MNMHESTFSGSHSEKNVDNSDGDDDKYLYCDSLEDGDIIVEEVIEASAEALQCDVKRSSNPDGSDSSDVILIDDEDDDDCYVPCVKKSKRHGNFRGIKNTSSSAEEKGKAVIALESSDDFIEEIIETPNGLRALNSPMSMQKSMVESFICELGMKLVLYNTVNSLDPNDLSFISQEFNLQEINSMSFLSLPQKFCRCGFKSESTLVFRDHLGMGKNFTQSKCCICNKYISKYFGKFSSHMKSQHNMSVHQLPKRAAFRCRFCKFDTNSQFNMDRHRRMCACKFSLNNNLVPTPDDQTFYFDFASESSRVSRPTSVIHANPQRSQSSASNRSFVPSNSSLLSTNFAQSQHQSVIVSNKTSRSDFETGQENYEVCEYCNGVVQDLKSLARHLDVVHKIKGSFVFKCSKCSPSIICSSEEEFKDHCKKVHSKNNSKKLKPGNSNKPPVVILDDNNGSIREFSSEDLSAGKSLKFHSLSESYFPSDGSDCVPYLRGCVLLESSDMSTSCNKEDLSVEIGLAKMAVRRECLWCPMKFESLELFEDHMVNKHKDVMWDVDSFWAFLETGFSQCASHKRGKESTSCSYCSQVFPSSFLYHRHILETHWNQHVESCAWCTEVTTQSLPVARRLCEASPEKLVNVIDLDDSCCESDNRENICNDYDDDDDDSTSTFLSNIDKEDTASTDSCNQYSRQVDEVEILDVNGEKVVVMKNV